MAPMTTLAGFTDSSFTHDGATRDVYRRGSGPAVVVMSEVPGITPEVQAFAERVADAGFAVYLPNLFGTPGRQFSLPYVLQTVAKVCISREFRILAAHESSPITDWLRALCRHAHGECGGKGVGAIGMCLTGNFALSLMVEPVVMAPVLSQPSLPLPVTREQRAGLHLSPSDLVTVKKRAAAGVPVLGLCFTRDPMCPPERFAHLRAELGEGFESIEIDSSPGNPHGIKSSAHSVLTMDLVDRQGHPTRQALERVLGFFRQQLY